MLSATCANSSLHVMLTFPGEVEHHRLKSFNGAWGLYPHSIKFARAMFLRCLHRQIDDCGLLLLRTLALVWYMSCDLKPTLDSML